MARKKDLGSLAALAGLAYMASRDKATQPEEGYRADPFGKMTQEERDARRDINGRTVADENYGNESSRPVRTPARSAAPSTPSVDAGRSPTMDDEAGMSRGTRPRPAAQVASTTEEGMRGYKPRGNPAGRAPKVTEGARPSPRLNAQELDDYTTYKKGGSVKGWGAARGARKAKIY